MKRYITVVVLAVGMLILCGCTGYSDSEQQYIVSAMGFDAENKKIKVSAETIIVNSEDSEESMNVTVFSGMGNNISEAIDDMRGKLARELLLSHCGVIAVGTSLSPEQLTGVMDYCYDEKNITLAAFIVSADDSNALLCADTVASLAIGYDIMGVLEQLGKDKNYRYYELEANRGESIELPFFKVSDKKYEMENVRKLICAGGGKYGK